MGSEMMEILKEVFLLRFFRFFYQEGCEISFQCGKDSRHESILYTLNRDDLTGV